MQVAAHLKTQVIFFPPAPSMALNLISGLGLNILPGWLDRNIRAQLCNHRRKPSLHSLRSEREAEASRKENFW